MTRQERIEWLAHELERVSNEEKEIKKRRALLRDDFFRLADHDWYDKEHLLPVVTITVPDEFFERTGLSKREFIETRYPGWNLEHDEYNTALFEHTFVMRRDPRFIPREVEVQDGEDILKVSKEVSEYTPDIDWKTLRDDNPDLFEKLAVPVEQYALNEESLEQIMEESPDDLATLQRHMKVKAPTVRVVPRRINGRKSESDTESGRTSE
jgi:hypothetical protein